MPPPLTPPLDAPPVDEAPPPELPPPELPPLDVDPPDVLPPEVRFGVPRTAGDDGETLVVRVGTPLADVTRRLILATLAQHQGNKTRAAETLGISLKTLYARLAEYRAQDAGQTEAQPDTENA